MTTDTQILLSQLGYAKHRGCTHGAVAKAIKTGRLARALVTGDDGKVRIDPAIADTEWASNSNPAMQRKESAAKSPAAPANTKTTPVKQKATAKGDGEGSGEAPQRFDALGILVPPSQDEDSGDGTSMAEARAMKELYLARMAKLDYEREAGIIIDAEEARRAAFNASRRARDMLLTVADRLAPIVAGLSDQFECHQAISAEVRRVLENLSANPLGEEVANGAGR